jgi:hypothetical protein
LTAPDRVRLPTRDGPGEPADAEGSAESGPGEAFSIESGFRGAWQSIGRVAEISAVLELEPLRMPPRPAAPRLAPAPAPRRPGSLA